MSEPAKTEELCDVGLPPVLDPGDPRRMNADWFKRSLAACSWLGIVPAPLFVPSISESMHPPGQKIRKWRVNMDVAHFCPSEISLRARGGFLEVQGKHDERPDEHGFIARCFSRKYRLPTEVDVTKLTSTLSVDGILTIEAPVPETSAPAAIIIPIKVETEEGEQEVKIEDKEEESQSEVHGDQDQSSSITAETEQEDEETQEKAAEETPPSVSAEDESLESLQKSSEQQKPLERLEGPVTSNQLEHKEPVMDDGAIQVKEVGDEELNQPEEQELGTNPPSDVQTLELEAADIKQEATE
ncbi:heat shock protein beta-1 isoform X2 [Kryptolebias marmoratus]|uniref:heat shock protein beta-1 isoform X2 n=1 Tax=Kryptolebias marmoratus TaxID=37003 RepID=UPI0007F934DB|nr:heat shock protein beta-1 isoform X2 [Kryptolebias marmoratus]